MRLLLIGHGFQGIPGFSEKKNYVLTKAHANTFCNVSIFAMGDLLIYL